MVCLCTGVHCFVALLCLYAPQLSSAEGKTPGYSTMTLCHRMQDVAYGRWLGQALYSTDGGWTAVAVPHRVCAL